MSKRTVTRLYIDAWVVWVVSIIALVLLTRAMRTDSLPPSGVAFVYAAMVSSAFLMFVMWVAALVKLARRHATFSFVTMLVLQLLGIGIVGMVSYAVSGPEVVADYAVRPHTT